MRISFYLDEHVGAAVANGLRQRGVDVLTVAEAGLLGGPDEDHLARARSEGRVIFSQDTDFLRMHAAGAPHAGIIYARHGTRVGDIVRGLVLIHQVLSSEEMANQIRCRGNST